MRATTLDRTLAALAPVTLDELDEFARLQTRTDRKYLLTPEQFTGLLSLVGDSSRALDVDGRRSFGYESRYFDTPALDSYLGAAHRRPRRFKVRTRRYLDSGACFVEVKLRDARGRTLKHRHTHPASLAGTLTDGSRAFLSCFELVQPCLPGLEPVLTTRYDRSTIVTGGSRATIDIGLRCSTGARTAGPAHTVIVETKTPHGPSDVDRALWAMHIRPLKVSKFAMGMATLHPDLPRNKWHRALSLHPWTALA